MPKNNRLSPIHQAHTGPLEEAHKREQLDKRKRKRKREGDWR
jgi:hypothetical protein